MKIRIRPIIFLLIFLAVSVFYILNPASQVLFTGELYLIFPVATALIGVYSSRIYRFNSANGRALILITGGLVCWGVGEITTYMLGKDGINFPSLAEAFLLLGYPLFGAGIYQGFVTADIKLKQVKKSLLAIVLSASIILTVLVAYFIVYQAYDPSSELIANVVGISLGLGDLVLVVASMITILVANEYKGGKLASFWKTMALGFILFLIADVLFAIYWEESDVMNPYQIFIELTWIAGYLVLAYGMLDNYINVSEVQNKIKLKLLQRK